MSEDNLDVNEWVRFAQMDYDAASNMHKLHHPTPAEIICYHCQQSVEKILKAFAIAKGEPLKKIHDLNILLNQCREHIDEFGHYEKECLALTSYASLSRYPTRIEITQSQMRQALEDSRRVLDFTKSRLEEMGYMSHTPKT